MNDIIWTKEFWAAAVTRGVRTAAQTALVTLGGNTVGLIGTDWIGVASLAIGAGIISVLTCVAWPNALPELGGGKDA
jgi:hypothetical protein